MPWPRSAPRTAAAVALFEQESMLAGGNIAEERLRQFAVGQIDAEGLPGADHREAGRGDAGRDAAAAVGEHELLAVRAGRSSRPAAASRPRRAASWK